MPIDNYFNKDTRIAKVKGALNCPNCGAPLERERCPYCGSILIDFAALNAREPFYMKIKDGDNVIILKVAMRSITTEYHNDETHVYSDNLVCASYAAQSRELSIDFSILE